MEAIRADVKNKVAIFRIGTALQSLMCMSLEYGHRRILQAVPEEQQDLLGTMLIDGLELAATALEEGTPLFEGMGFPSSDKVFALTPGIMIDPQPKDKKDLQGKPCIPAGEEECFVKKYFLPHTGNRREI